jgi:integrase
MGIGARALEFAVLTAARGGEVRGATWSEFDLGNAVWTIRGERMKSGKDHRVPLSDAAMRVLSPLPRLREQSAHVFEPPRHGPLSDMALTSVMRRMEVDAVPHGFRSTFRDWSAELTNYPNELCEAALAHKVADKVEAA